MKIVSIFHLFAIKHFNKAIKKTFPINHFLSRERRKLHLESAILKIPRVTCSRTPLQASTSDTQRSRPLNFFVRYVLPNATENPARVVKLYLLVVKRSSSTNSNLNNEKYKKKYHCLPQAYSGTLSRRNFKRLWAI